HDVPRPAHHTLTLHDALPIDGRDAQPLGEVVEEGGAVILDVGTDGVDGTVNGLAHGHEPNGPRRPPRSAVSHRTGPRRGAVPVRSKSTRLNSSHVKTSYAVVC